MLTRKVQLVDHHAWKGQMQHYKYRVFASQRDKGKLEVSPGVEGSPVA